jgi:hypothetical protein
MLGVRVSPGTPRSIWITRVKSLGSERQSVGVATQYDEVLDGNLEALKIHYVRG